MKKQNVIIVYASEEENREQFINVLTAAEGEYLRRPILDPIMKKRAMALHLDKIKTDLRMKLLNREMFKTVVIDINVKYLNYLIRCLATRIMPVDKIIISTEASSLDIGEVGDIENLEITVVMSTDLKTYKS